MDRDGLETLQDESQLMKGRGIPEYPPLLPGTQGEETYNPEAECELGSTSYSELTILNVNTQS